MKSFVQFTLAASIAASVAAQPHQQHGHQHRHAKKHAPNAVVEKRDPSVVTVYEAGPTETVYQLDGELINKNDAKKGIEDKIFVVIGESTPTFAPPPPPSTTAVPPTSSVAAQFFESKTPVGTPAPSAAASTSNNAGTGLDAKFPSGTIPCSQFPSSYGPIPINYLGIGGWVGIQQVPNYTPGDAAISYIVAAVAGGGCTTNSFCSYACPVGYQKTQWPTAQGSTLQSIGGLYCNAKGMLELSRPEYPTLCEQGAGGVWIQNDLDGEANVCRTDYPGDEAMTIPLAASPGGKYPLTNPYSPNYYIWNGNPTTAQYYVNKKGIKTEDSCLWNSKVDPTGAGNWAPINIGVGKNKDGITFMSIFPNAPTTTAKLDFNIEIIGDVNAKCYYINGQYFGGSNGCTTAVTGSGQAIIRFFQ